MNYEVINLLFLALLVLTLGSIKFFGIVLNETLGFRPYLDAKYFEVLKYYGFIKYFGSQKQLGVSM